ncbi:MAG: flavohemoglobin expression-modulating QEGLA motif protein [Chloroflexota bacterium]|nr:flavohemoglobin expression-modulating QEGLA motif protein [Chloroflexota bacterium]
MTFADFEATYWDLEAKVDFFRLLQPDNAVEQKQQFLQALGTSIRLNPVFRYAPPDSSLIDADERIAALLRSLETFPNHPLYEAYENLISKVVESISLMRLRRSDVEFRKRLTAIWGTPTEQELTDARAFLSTSETPAAPEKDLTAGVLADTLRSSMLWATDDWDIEEDRNLSARVSVSPLRKRIRIRADAMFDEAEVRRYLVHEVGVHVTRYENGAMQPFLLFRHGFPQYLATEEGLAVYAEEQAGVTDVSVLRKYAGRLVATEAAARGSFLDVYSELIEWFAPSEAYEIAQRVKRGLEDTGYPGGYTKDLAYFRGYRSVKAHLSQGCNVVPLLVGKVGLQDLSLVDEMLDLRLLVPPKHVPSFFKAAISEAQR